MRVDEKLQQTAGISEGDTATLEIESTKDWPEPNVPQDLETALAAAPQKIQDLWNDITPMARWEWVRWVNATNNPDTRRRRVDVSMSKMNSGKRRPCCFQPCRMHRPVPVKKRQAHRTSAINRRAHWTTTLPIPVGLSQGVRRRKWACSAGEPQSRCLHGASSHGGSRAG